MNSRVTFKEIIAMCLVITSFTVTGIMIMNENYKYALISLCVVALCVLLAFLAIVIGEDNNILDLSNPSLRNPRKSNSGKRVTYISRLTPDMASGNRKSRKNGAGNMYQDTLADDGDFYESVGNMRVYQRGEEIEFHDDEDS